VGLDVAAREPRAAELRARVAVVAGVLHGAPPTEGDHVVVVGLAALAVVHDVDGEGDQGAVARPLLAAETREPLVAHRGPDAVHHAVELDAVDPVDNLELALGGGDVHHVRLAGLLGVERDGVARARHLVVRDDLPAARDLHEALRGYRDPSRNEREKNAEQCSTHLCLPSMWVLTRAQDTPAARAAGALFRFSRFVEDHFRAGHIRGAR